MTEAELQELIESISLQGWSPERILRLKEKLKNKRIRVEVAKLFRTPPEKK